MDKAEFLLKLMLLGFEVTVPNSTVIMYTNKNIRVELINLRTGREVTRVWDKENVCVLFTSIKNNYEKTLTVVLNELGTPNDNV